MAFVFRSAPVRTTHTARAARVARHVSGQRHASSTAQSGVNIVSNSIKTIAYTTTAVVGTTLFAIYYADSRSAIHRYVVPPLSRVLLDAESAHKLALGVLRSGLGPRDQDKDDERLKVEVGTEKY
jgi:dihydroorotate dehydrogenase